MLDSFVYDRSPGVVHRWVPGAALAAGPDRHVRRLEGAAALVWVVLSVPGSVDDLTARIQADWPELVGVDAPSVTAALGSLIDAGLVVNMGHVEAGARLAPVSGSEAGH